MVCTQHPHTYYGARNRRIASRSGPQKANVAIQHPMLIAIWHMGTTGTLYEDPGADYFARLNPNRARRRAVLPSIMPVFGDSATASARSVSTYARR
jgi:hypothetical protein